MALLVACGGSPTCDTEGAETRVTVDASELVGVQKICIGERCSVEGDGSLRLLARYVDERPERVDFEVTLADGDSHRGGVQLTCGVGARNVTLTPKPHGSTNTVVQ